MDRKSGVLMHISSLSSPYGIGTMGRSARDFVDFLVEAGQKYWQILPLNPTDQYGSPYAGLSAFAWNTELIESFEIGGKRMVFSGDFSQRVMDYTWTIIVNKEMAEKQGLKDSIYDTVRNGDWTIEKLKQNCANITSDSSGDGTLDHNDTWGFLSSKNVATALMTSSDIKTVVRDSKGSLKFNLNNATSIEKLQKKSP